MQGKKNCGVIDCLATCYRAPLVMPKSYFSVVVPDWVSLMHLGKRNDYVIALKLPGWLHIMLSYCSRSISAELLERWPQPPLLSSHPVPPSSITMDISNSIVAVF